MECSSAAAPLNPWVRDISGDPKSPEPRRPRKQPQTPTNLAPQPGVAPPDPAQQLARRTLSRDELFVPVWWVGAHGGAGETTLEQLVPPSRAARHAWPVSPDPDRPSRTVLVARTHYSGLTAAQRALRDWASGSVPTQLDGLVLIADAPGKVPPDLRSLIELVASAAPGQTWQLPWQPDWRLGHVTLDRASPQAQQLIRHLNHQKEP
jgi:hypothetical protein